MRVKYQITLPDDLASELKQTAARLRVPLAQFIRETMEQRLRTTYGKRKTMSGYPLASIIGLVDSAEQIWRSRRVSRKTYLC